MEQLQVVHLMALGMWLGVVIAEAQFEYSGSDAEFRRAAAHRGRGCAAGIPVTDLGHGDGR